MDLDAILNTNSTIITVNGNNDSSSNNSNSNHSNDSTRNPPPPPRTYSSIYSRIKQQLGMPRQKQPKVGAAPNPKRMLASKSGMKKRGTHGVGQNLTLKFKQGKAICRMDKQEEKSRKDAAEERLNREGTGNVIFNEEEAPEGAIPHFTPINEPTEGHPVEFTPINTPVSTRSKRDSSTISELSDIPAEIEAIFREEEEKNEEKPKPKSRRGAAKFITKLEPVEPIVDGVDGLSSAPESFRDVKPLVRRRAVRTVKVKTE